MVFSFCGRWESPSPVNFVVIPLASWLSERWFEERETFGLSEHVNEGPGDDSALASSSRLHGLSKSPIAASRRR